MADPIFAPYYANSMQLTPHGLRRLRLHYDGLKFNSANIEIDDRPPKDNWLKDGVHTSISVSGSAGDLVRYGFVDEARTSVPPCGTRHFRNREGRGYFTVHRNLTTQTLRLTGNIENGTQLLHDALEDSWFEFDRWRCSLLREQDKQFAEALEQFQKLPQSGQLDMLAHARALVKRAHLRLVVNNTPY